MKNKPQADHNKVFKFIEKHLIDKKQSDFPSLSAENCRFLFTTRMHYQNHCEKDKPFYFSPKQFNFLKDIIKQNDANKDDFKELEKKKVKQETIADVYYIQEQLNAFIKSKNPANFDRAEELLLKIKEREKI